MIGRLRGEVIEVEGTTLVVDVGGIGYEVSGPETVLLASRVGDAVDLYTRQIFREDLVSLYGFTTMGQRRIFDMLLTVKGCGPKAALALLGQVGEESVVSAVLAQDAKPLTRAFGVGLKMAERIVLELRDKIKEEAILRSIPASERAAARAAAGDELSDALLTLGYRRSEIEAISGQVREHSTDVQEQLKHALRLLKK